MAYRSSKTVASRLPSQERSSRTSPSVASSTGKTYRGVSPYTSRPDSTSSVSGSRYPWHSKEPTKTEHYARDHNTSSTYSLKKTGQKTDDYKHTTTDFCKPLYGKAAEPDFNLDLSSDVQHADPRSQLKKFLDVTKEMKNIDIDKCLQEYKALKENGDPTGFKREEEYVKNRSDEMNVEMTITKREIEELRIENDEMKKKLNEAYEKLEEQTMKAEQKMDASLVEAKRETEKLKKQLEELQEKKRTTMEEWQTILDEFNTKDMNSKAEIESLQKKVEELEGHSQDLEKRRRKAEQDKAEALTRLSREMGSKLNDRNPNIADLSDANRPTKLAEKYNELYDNEWTDALEAFESMGEEAAIKILLNIIQTAYQFCEKVASEQMQTIQNQLRNPIFKRQLTAETNKCDTNNSFEEISKIIADYRKSQGGSVSVDELYKEFIAWRSTGKYAMQVEEYTKKCLELCWLMVIQSPEVVIGAMPAAGDTIDFSIYKEYTKTGTAVSFAVWLPLYLHKNGPLLSKGVVQPISVRQNRRMKSAPAGRLKETEYTARLATTNPTYGTHSRQYDNHSKVDEPLEEHKKPVETNVDDFFDPTPRQRRRNNLKDNQIESGDRQQRDNYSAKERVTSRSPYRDTGRNLPSSPDSSPNDKYRSNTGVYKDYPTRTSQTIKYKETYPNSGRDEYHTRYGGDTHQTKPKQSERESRQSKGPRLVTYKGTQLIEYDGQYFTWDEWDAAQKRMLSVPKRGQSEV